MFRAGVRLGWRVVEVAGKTTEGLDLEATQQLTPAQALALIRKLEARNAAIEAEAQKRRKKQQKGERERSRGAHPRPFEGSIP